MTLLELFGLESIIDAYGLVMFSSGISVSFGLPLIGYLIHDLKSYDEAFAVAGGLFFLSGVLSIFLLFNHVDRNDSKWIKTFIDYNYLKFIISFIDSTNN